MKDNGSNLPTWAPRVKPYLISRLYESDARGLIDTDLLEEVGWALYSRCDSFIQANGAMQGRVQCPVCRSTVSPVPQAKGNLRCAACGWECTRQAYIRSIKNQQLAGGPEVIALFQKYLDMFPKAQNPPEKMLRIDELIHGFHHYLTSGRSRRPVVINLIDGHLEFVIDFLDHLTYGPDSTPGLAETHETWREKVVSKPARKRK